MSLNRYATKRDINEAEIVAALREVGATVVQLDKPVDLLVGYQGKTFLIEVKQPGEKRNGTPIHDLTLAQSKFFADWWGGPLVAVRSVDEALFMICAPPKHGKVRIQVEAKE